MVERRFSRHHNFQIPKDGGTPPNGGGSPGGGNCVMFWAFPRSLASEHRKRKEVPRQLFRACLIKIGLMDHAAHQLPQS